MDILEKLDTGRDIEGCTKEDLHASSYRDNSLHRGSDYSMARECRVLKNWTGLRVVPTWLTNFTIIVVSPRRYLKSTMASLNCDMSLIG